MKNSNLEATCLYIALDLGSTKWTLALSPGGQSRPRHRDIEAGCLDVLAAEIKTACERFRLPEGAPVRSCYEAGRDGFWLHRALVARGIDNVVVDPGSITVPRKRRAKTDRLDARTLLDRLCRHHAGERAWSVVHVPTEEVEDERRMERERERLTKERTALRNQIFNVLATCGVPRPKHPPQGLDGLVSHVGCALPPGAKHQLLRLNERLALVEQHLKTISDERTERMSKSEGRVCQTAKRLCALKGIGELSGYALALEGLGWRDFRNVKQVGASTGLVPTPFISDQSSRDLGVSKAARPKLRSLLVQLSWLWLRYQPDSALTKWYLERFATAKRSRRIGIVAVARKLYIALWKYVTWGEVPDGAVLSA